MSPLPPSITTLAIVRPLTLGVADIEPDAVRVDETDASTPVDDGTSFVALVAAFAVAATVVVVIVVGDGVVLVVITVFVTGSVFDVPVLFAETDVDRLRRWHGASSALPPFA